MDVKAQLRSVIQWTDPDPELLFERWTDSGDEIKNASRLIMGPGQGCVFVYEGQVKGMYGDAGMIQLATANVPFWTTIRSAMQGFVSEHKVGLYFFRSAHVLNRRWGTVAVVKYEDPKYRFPVGLRAFGNYSLRITEPEAFFRTVVAGAHQYAVKQIQEVILSRMNEPLAQVLASSRFSYAEIDAHRLELSQKLSESVDPIFKKLGFELLDLRIEGTSFDEVTEGRIGKIADKTADAQAAAAAGVDYATLERLAAMRDAAKNEGTGGLGVVLGVGANLGQLAGQGPAPQAAPAPDDPMVKLEKLKTMFDRGLITADEYQAKKADILAKM